HYLFIKNGEETETDPDLIYLPMDQTELKLADVLYDYVCLSLPLRQVVDCENMSNPPCNRDVLDRLQNAGASAPEPSVWDVLKKLNSN
ncbi:MAG TPA: hypothetical protein VFX48_01250, partial [Saprospiraceae bacterium]|nr:hypothetical protein [Saprospiraceae bacterium]